MTHTMVIADDHELVREALARYAVECANWKVIAAVPSAEDALRACRCHQPDLLVLDVGMPGRDPLAAMLDIRSASPTTRIVVLSGSCRDDSIELAVRHGAMGYVLKSDPTPHIFAAFERALHGHRVYSPPVAARLAANVEGKPASHPESTRLSRLTPRELEVLRAIARGLSNDDMARCMSISKRTVERHVARLMDAIAIRDRVGMARFAFENGICGL